VRAEDHLAVRRAVVADDDALAAAEVEAGHRVLVRHAAGQPQRVDHRLLVGRVVPEARAAERRAERGVVDGDDAAVAARLVVAHDELLVPHLGDGVEQAQRRRAFAGARLGLRRRDGRDRDRVGAARGGRGGRGHV
jgi:hypothetical protein